jgi:hypothetical protein
MLHGLLASLLLRLLEVLQEFKATLALKILLHAPMFKHIPGLDVLHAQEKLVLHVVVELHAPSGI